MHLLALVATFFYCSCALTIVEPAELNGTHLLAPILEINAFTVMKQNQRLWGKSFKLWIPPDESGCTGVNGSGQVVFVSDGGCSAEEKSRIWSAQGAVAIIVAQQFQWVADLAALMSDGTDIRNIGIPCFFLKYGVNYQNPPTRDWGMHLWDLVKSGTSVTLTLDFPDRQYITWDLRTGRATPSAFLNFMTLFWAITLLCFLSIKVSLMLDKANFNLNVPLVILMLDMVSCFFIILAGIFGPFFSSGYYSSEAALFFQTFYIPWCLSATTLLSFYWLEITFFNERVGARIKKLFWPSVANCICLFVLELTRDILLAVNAPPLASYYVSVIGYAVFGLLAFALLFFAVFRVLTRLSKSGSALSKSVPRLAFFMIMAILGGLTMLSGLFIYAIYEFHRYMTAMFLNIFLLEGGALFMMTAHNFLFEMRTQRQLVEMGIMLEHVRKTSSPGPNVEHDESNGDEDHQV